MKNIIGTIVLAISTEPLGGCETAPAASPGETAGPALQSAYCVQHANERRCLKP